MSIKRARLLRSNQTDAERKLWRSLRILKAEGFHLRRQAPVDHLIVDFACLTAHLVIELDGGQHNFNAGARSDAARDSHLYARGFNVLRFWNNDVMTNLDGVMEVILRALGILPGAEEITYSPHQAPPHPGTTAR
jgi:very-short-patch-repair endonuclease